LSYQPVRRLSGPAAIASRLVPGRTSGTA
jgi:hypothetical protein